LNSLNKSKEALFQVIIWDPIFIDYVITYDSIISKSKSKRKLLTVLQTRKLLTIQANWRWELISICVNWIILNFISFQANFSRK
jgi:hypothetical protein